MATMKVDPKPFSLFNLKFQSDTITRSIRAMVVAAAEESGDTAIEMMRTAHQQGKITEAEVRFIIKRYSNA